MKRSFIMGAALAFGVAGVAQGAEVNFSFLGGDAQASSMLFSQGGVNLTVTAETEDIANDKIESAWVVQSSSIGLGVNSIGLSDIPDQVDGDILWNESLIFDFSPSPVTLSTVQFTLVDYTSPTKGDLVVINVDGGLESKEIRLGDNGTVLLQVAQSGSSFRLSSTNRNDDWGVAGLSISTEGSAASAVPLPSVASLGALLLGGVGLVRRRSRKD